MTPLERLVRRSEIGLCWSVRKPSGNGYGYAQIDGKMYRAHRWAWEHLVGPLAPEQHLDHLCRNRACWNPDHLEPVTPRQNVLRGVGVTSSHAAQEECIHGHAFDEVNTYWRPDGSRGCRRCRADAAGRARQRRRAARAATMTA